jgi:hypothetical protein
MSSKISCKQAVDYISKKEEGKLSTTQRFRLWQHLAACPLCRRYSAQNKLIIQAIKGIDIRQLSAAEKEEIVRNILEEK